MIPISSTTRIFVATGATDMRKSFDGLIALVQDVLEEDPLAGHLFLFRNRRGNRIKILWWDRTGFCIWYKHLQKNTFPFPRSSEGRAEIDARDLAMILEGLEFKTIQKRSVYRLRRESIAA